MELAIGIIGILLTLWGIKLQFFSKPKEEFKAFYYSIQINPKIIIASSRRLGEIDS